MGNYILIYLAIGSIFSILYTFYFFKYEYEPIQDKRLVESKKLKVVMVIVTFIVGTVIFPYTIHELFLIAKKNRRAKQ
jgi:NADH:ubiquinone oxidoreductase subunit 5 (subunit L)/multisubunit Na+/H+ antiporter MnhA subunit